MADIDSLAAALFGTRRAETQEVLTDATTRTYTGTAVTDSEDGTVIVDLGGDVTLPDDVEGLAEYSADGVEVATGPGVRAGDEVVVTLVGGTPLKTPMVTGVAGEGDRQDERIHAIEADYVKASMLEADVADIGFLKADSATITSLQADTAKIHDLTADQLSAATAYIATLTANSVTAASLTADVAKVHDLTAQQLSAAAGYIAQLTADSVTAQAIAAMYGDFDTVKANAAKVQSLTAEQIIADHETVGSLDANYAHITNGVIDNAKIGYADVDNLSAHYAEIQNGKINSALIDTAAIVDEQVFTVTGNKATIEEINADKITVRNLNAKNLTVETADGYVTIGDKKTPTKEYLESLKDELQQEIDGAVETFTSSAVPLLNNYPASDWIISGATEEEQRKAYAKHVGDICYVQNPALDQNGYAYRFAYDSTEQTFKWVLIKDSDVTKALGDISDLKTFESDTTTWMKETDEGLRTIRQNHTALSGVVDKTVVETKQLWHTKANTTAPGKPTKEITSTSTAGNAWRVVVPAYNVSYPNYYYCLQYKLADGTYAWSDVVRDIAMGESQQQGRKGVADAATAQSTADNAATAASTADGKAVAAQNTANTNIKSSVQLWFTKANTTAPSKPTAQVTVNDATKTNQWNLAIPTYSSSYPNYFYCYQQQKGDGTWQWTDVVYDRSITEAQAKAQSALPSSEFNTFKTTTFKEVVDEVGEHSTSISTLTETVSTKADSSTVETLSNTVNTVKQTADTNKTSITNLTQTVNSKADSTTVTTLTNRVSTAEQNLDGITTRVGKTESAIETVSNPNLSPFFSFALDNYYNASSNPDGYWDANKASYGTNLSDGWAHFSKNNTGSRSTWFTLYEHSAWRHAHGDLKGSTKYTVMIEFRNVTKSGNVTCIGTSTHASSWPSMFVGNSDKGNVAVADGVQYHIGTTVADPSSVTGNTCTTRTLITIPAGASIDCDVRVSLYEGEYSGPYKPYVDQTDQMLSSRVKSAETAIEQNAEAITLRATKAEVQSLGGNLLTDTDNPVLGSNVAPKYAVVSGGNGTGTIATVTDSPLPNYEKAFRITGNTSGNRGFAQSVGIVYGQKYLFTAYARGIGGEAKALIRVYSGSELFIYATVVGTDWTPIRTIVTLTGAGSAAYYFFQFGLTGAGSIEYIAPCLSGGAAANTAAELKVANDNINLKVSKNDVINQINVSTEGAKIDADKVEIDGTAVFNAAKSKLDAAYDAKGAAATAENNAKTYTDALEIGGRNLVYSSGDYAGWLKDSVTTFSGDELDINVSGQTANKFYGAKQWLTRTSNDLYGSFIVVSFEVYSDAWESVTSDRNAGLDSAVVQISSVTNPYGSSASGAYGLYRYLGLAGSIHWTKLPTQENGKWLKFESIPVDIPAGLTNTDLGTELKPYLMVQLMLRRNGHVKFRRIKVEIGTKATDWTPAPEDIEANAVKRTQRIWYRTNGSSAPATPGTASSNWVTKADDGNDAWTKMHVAISSTHKYIYTCEQYEMANGTVGYTSVLLDNTITVIDGGNIITGSVKANAISASSGTFDVANIPNLSAAKITSGTIDAARIDASKLTIGGSGLATSSDVSTAIKSVSQNWFATCTTAAGTKDKVATITPTTTDFSLKAGATVNVKFTNTNSYNATASSHVTLNVNSTGAKNIYYGASSAPTGTNTTPFGRANYTNTYVYDGTYWVWVSSSADNNTTDIPRSKYEVNISAAEAVTNGHIICGTSSGYRNIAANVSFDLNYPLLFAGTAITKGATTGTRNNNFAKYQNADFSKNGTITSGAASKMLYLKGTVDGKTFKIAASPFMTTVVPTSDDGFAYIPLGYMSSATVGYFDSSTDVYAFRNGAFQKLDTVAKYITAITDSGIRVHAKTNPTKNYAAIDADGLDVVKDSVSVAQFGKSDDYGPSTRIGQESKTHIIIDTTENDESTGDVDDSDYWHVHDETSEIKLYGADGTRPNLRLYDNTRTEETKYDGGELSTSEYEAVGIKFGENGNESVYDAGGTEIATGTTISTSVMEDYADLEILTGNMYSKRGAHTTIENTRRWASNEDYDDTTIISMNVNEGGYQPNVSMKAISGGSSAEVNVTASGRVGEVQIQADEISLMGVGCYITHGYTSDATTPANSYKDFTIVYGHTYSTYPHVIVGMFSNSTSPTIGSIQVAVASVGYDSATVRVFNNTSSQRSPRFYWLAIG